MTVKELTLRQKSAPLTETEEAALYLLEGADIIDDRWCRGAMALNALGRAVPVLSDDAVRHCAIGGIHKAAGVEAGLYVTGAWSTRALQIAKAAMLKHINWWIDDIGDWNNHQERASDVSSVMRAAARSLLK